MKAIRSINIGVDTPSLPKFTLKSNDEIIEIIKKSDNERIFAVYEALKRGVTFDIIYGITGIDFWYLAKLKNIADMEEALKSALDDEIYILAKNLGFLEQTIKRISGRDLPIALAPTYKMVDTCAAEFDAQKPYFYSAWDDDNEAKIFADISNRGKKKVLILCSGPNTVGFGDELEYCNAHCIKSLKKLGYSTIVSNNNPDVTSTDFYTSDRLYIDPLTVEDSKHIIETERPWGVIAQFSGINTLELSESLNNYPVKVLGADSKVIKTLEDLDKLWDILSSLNIPHTAERKLNGTVIEADVIYDGEYCFIPAVVELIEHANVNSGDSITVYPAITLTKKINELIFKYSTKIARHFDVRGIINLQFMLYNNSLYVTEVRYDTVHNIPFVSKATGLPVVEIALRCMLGEKLSDMGCCNGIYESGSLCAVRVPVFSFDKLCGADIQLGAQMKSTGEVLGLGSSFEDALLKGLTASGMRIKRSGSILVSVRNSDKQESISVIEKFSNLGFNIFATAGTAKTLNSNFVAANSVRKIHEGNPSTLDLINDNKVVYVISTSEKGDAELRDDVTIRRRALERQIPTFTTLETANALTRCLANKRSIDDIEIIDIANK
jgi:carbamoyl-phosphate synthase large subunit